MIKHRNHALRLAPAALAVLFTSSFASAFTYGDVEITVRNEPRGAAYHGYAEYEFLVTNRSPASHQVEITFPKVKHGYGSDYLRSVSRTTTVEAGNSVRVVIAFPERNHPGGNIAGVTIDGREEDEFSVSGSGGRSYGYHSSSPGPQTLTLYSKDVDTRFPDWVNRARGGAPGAGVPPGGGIPGPGAPGPGVPGMAAPTPGPSPSSDSIVRAVQDVKEWSTNWLAYTRYDGIVLTGRDLSAMPADVRNAIGQYVECGGSLLVLGYTNAAPLPGAWKLQPGPTVSTAKPGFGECIVTEETDLELDPSAVLNAVTLSWNTTSQPWQRVYDPNNANHVFPVVDDVSVPVKGLLALMVVFVLIIGPINLYVLARKKRKLWLFWTVPAISFTTCLVVLLYMAITEGWQGHSRVEGLTVLDENSRRASSIGWAGYYTPIPRGGLHFSPETELGFQNGEDPYSPYSPRYSRRSSISALTMDWTQDQHLSSGWLTPRVPAHFAVRKSELRRERMTITKGGDGVPEAVNGLGADVSEFWYRDEAGKFFHVDKIPAGERVKLAPEPEQTSPGTRDLRSVYSGDWTKLPETLKSSGPAMLAPRTYFGIMESAPFFDDGMPGATDSKKRSAVYGILKEGGSGG